MITKLVNHRQRGEDKNNGMPSHRRKATVILQRKMEGPKAGCGTALSLCQMNVTKHKDELDLEFKNCSEGA